MEMPNKKGWLAIGFIVICLAVPFGLTYYVSTSGFKEKYARLQEPPLRAPVAGSPAAVRPSDGRVTLVKGERIGVHNTSLVYRGVENGRVHVDLYLEELDPDRAYPQQFLSAKDDVVRLGDVSYRVAAVGQNTLVMEIMATMGGE